MDPVASDPTRPEDGSQLDDLFTQVVLEQLGRSVIPIEARGEHADGGTVFLYGHPVDASGSRVAVLAVTARGLARGDLVSTVTPRHMVEPSDAPADAIVWPHWAKDWRTPHDPAVDLAFSPFGDLVAHAERKGWHWNPQWIGGALMPADGEELAALTDFVAAVGYEPSVGRMGETPKPRALRAPLKATADRRGAVSVGPSYVGAPCIAAGRVSGEPVLRMIGVVGSNAIVDPQGQVWRVLVPSHVVAREAATMFERFSAGSS
jgi:hypothetical protein